MIEMNKESEKSATNRRLLRLRSGDNPLSVPAEEWRPALETADPDPVVGIRHKQLSGDSTYGIHVASIRNQVGCHVHLNSKGDQCNDGDEVYAIVSGRGAIHFAPVTKGPDGVFVRDADWCSLPVQAGDSFIIPAGYAHQLRREGESELVILFGCPAAHLKDDEDRTLLPDAPRA